MAARRHPDARTGFQEIHATVPPAPPQAAPELHHRLRVAGAVTHDAAQIWAELWGQLHGHVTTTGSVLPGLDKGFVPACGWAEFLEKFCLLKHHLDSASRLCTRE